MHKQGLVWLASYPKSGNTWFRAFLTHLLSNNSDSLNLQQDSMIGQGAAARFVLDKALGFDSRLLNEQQLQQLRPAIYQWHGQQPGIKYFKIHDSYVTNEQKPILPQYNNIGIIYFIRNPLDVVVSFAHHMNCTIDEAILMMNNPLLSLTGASTRRTSQIKQTCATWSSHVESWTTQSDVRILVVRYEDMHRDTFNTFSKALDFLNVPYDEHTVRQAINNSQFARLQQSEQQDGFKESAAPNRPFFRKGIIGDWQNVLKEQQIKRIITQHGLIMRRFGYLES